MGLIICFGPLLRCFFVDRGSDAANSSRILWMKLGGLLHKAVSPALLSLLYFLEAMPIALIMQMLRMKASAPPIHR
jgi:hypothetical protein